MSSCPGVSGPVNLSHCPTMSATTLTELSTAGRERLGGLLVPQLRLLAAGKSDAVRLAFLSVFSSTTQAFPRSIPSPAVIDLGQRGTAGYAEPIRSRRQRLKVSPYRRSTTFTSPRSSLRPSSVLRTPAWANSVRDVRHCLETSVPLRRVQVDVSARPDVSTSRDDVLRLQSARRPRASYHLTLVVLV